MELAISDHRILKEIKVGQVWVGPCQSEMFICTDRLLHPIIKTQRLYKLIFYFLFLMAIFDSDKPGGKCPSTSDSYIVLAFFERDRLLSIAWRHTAR